MSSILLSPKHFNSVEKELTDFIIKNTQYIPYTVIEKYSFLSKIDKLNEIMDRIRMISVLSYHLQYKEPLEQIPTDTAMLLNNKEKSEKLTKAGLFLAIETILYQIKIDVIEKHRELTKEEHEALEFLEIISYSITKAIVSETDDYKNAKYMI